MLLMDRTVRDFTEELASASPAPGGGTIAAVNGAYAAGLACMACALTVRKPKNEEAPANLGPVALHLTEAKLQFMQYAEDDTEAFNKVMAAFALPKETEAEQVVRRQAIAEANLLATKVPLQTARLATEVSEALVAVVQYANGNVLSDCGVALECARTAALGAFMNVGINLPSVKDEEAVAAFATELKILKKRLGDAYEKGAGALGVRFTY